MFEFFKKNEYEESIEKYYSSESYITYLAVLIYLLFTFRIVPVEFLILIFIVLLLQIPEAPLYSVLIIFFSTTVKSLISSNYNNYLKVV